MHLIINEPLGHTQIVEAPQLDVLTQNGWRLVAVIQDTHVVETLEPMAAEEHRQVYGEDRSYGSHQGYNAHPNIYGTPEQLGRQSGELFVTKGLKAVGRVCTRTRFVVAKHLDATMAALADSNEAIRKERDRVQGDVADLQRQLDAMQRKAEENERLATKTAEQLQVAQKEDGQTREYLRLQGNRVQQYERDLGKLRKALGDVQVDLILRGKP